jgi:TonB-dependent starch-binding outer membrane protein SusC
MRYQDKYKFFLLGLLIIGGIEIFAQEEFIISGRVINSRQEPVGGVSVILEGQYPSPEITGEDGYFSLTSETREYWIVFTPFEKYKTRRIFNTGSQEDLSIYLTDNDLESGNDQVLDIGREQERKNLVSSIHTVDADKFDISVYQSLDQFFQGTVPGGLFINQSGQPGSGGPVFLRGQTSLFAGNMPLIIVDGVPLESATLYNSLVSGSTYNPLSLISPRDVSNISILRGASTALYGVKGSNGVILIETLKTRDITTRIDFSLKGE